MDFRELKKLVQLMNDNDLLELEIEEEGKRVTLRKDGGGVAPAAPPQYALPHAVHPAPAPADAPSVPEPAEPAGPPAGTREIVSPMVGTFYRRPSPDADPYTNIGEHVNGETIVCIVEAMKVNNEIKAEMDGEIVEILVEDGEPVEFDQPLFRVKVA